MTYKTKPCIPTVGGFITKDGFKSNAQIEKEYEDYKEYLKQGFSVVAYDYMYELDLLTKYINKHD